MNLIHPGIPACSGQGHRLDRAFSLVEIIIAITLLSVIVLGLMAMFTQTQRAFKTGLMQTDILESGRIATDMIVREMEQMTPTYRQAAYGPCFYKQLMYISTNVMVSSTIGRSNVVDDVFFITSENKVLSGIGYFVRRDTDFSIGPVGTLYRYESNKTSAQFSANPDGLLAGFDRSRSNSAYGGLTRIMDGVVSFRIRAFEPQGFWLDAGTSYPGNSNVLILPSVAYGTAARGQVTTEAGWYVFYSNAVPAFIELELGILEPQTYEKYLSIPVPAAQQNFLRQQSARVHLFRQRIAIRNVDLTAYQ